MKKSLYTVVAYFLATIMNFLMTAIVTRLIFWCFDINDRYSLKIVCGIYLILGLLGSKFSVKINEDK